MSFSAYFDVAALETVASTSWSCRHCGKWLVSDMVSAEKGGTQPIHGLED